MKIRKGKENHGRKSGNKAGKLLTCKGKRKEMIRVNKQGRKSGKTKRGGG
jgi:hypothetical protein